MQVPNEVQKPLSDLKLEIAVLGAMLQLRDAVPTALAFFRPGAEVFYLPRHQTIFRAMARLHATGDGIDIMTVTAVLREAGQLDQCGGAQYVAAFTQHVESAANLTTHCAILLDLYAKRRTAELAQQLLATAYDVTAEPGDVLAAAQHALNAIQDSRQVRRAQTMGDLFPLALDEVVQATQTPGGLTGVPTCLAALDRVTGGWQPGQLIIIAARPGMGKTSVTLAMANLAEATGQPGLFCSLEMSAMELVKKAIGTATGRTTNQLQRGGGMSPAEAEDLRTQAPQLAASRLLIDDTPALSIGELRAKATKAKAEHGIRIVYVDYLQLMTGDTKGNREQEIGSISRGLKMIAKELAIPVIALSQLSRAVETRGGDKKPQLSDLRESGSIEQDADLVIFPYRAEYYGVEQDADGNPTAGLTELILAKHRSGSLANVFVKSNMATGKYEDLEADKPFEVPGGSFRQLPKSDFEQDPPF
ncbi:MAG: replicative DNA helicase [Hymenobacter sp.]